MTGGRVRKSLRAKGVAKISLGTSIVLHSFLPCISMFHIGSLFLEGERSLLCDPKRSKKRCSHTFRVEVYI